MSLTLAFIPPSYPLTNTKNYGIITLDKELEKYLESLFDLFTHPGWKAIVDNLEASKEAINSVSSIPDSKTLYFRQGQLEVINTLLSLPSLAEQSYKAAQEAPE